MPHTSTITAQLNLLKQKLRIVTNQFLNTCATYVHVHVHVYVQCTCTTCWYKTCTCTLTCPPVLSATWPSSMILQSVPLIDTRDTVTLRGRREGGKKERGEARRGRSTIHTCIHVHVCETIRLALYLYKKFAMSTELPCSLVAEHSV